VPRREADIRAANHRIALLVASPAVRNTSQYMLPNWASIGLRPVLDSLGLNLGGAADVPMQVHLAQGAGRNSARDRKAMPLRTEPWSSSSQFYPRHIMAFEGKSRVSRPTSFWGEIANPTALPATNKMGFPLFDFSQALLQPLKLCTNLRFHGAL
jgi:hypothetical protein